MGYIALVSLILNIYLWCKYVKQKEKTMLARGRNVKVNYASRVSEELNKISCDNMINDKGDLQNTVSI